MSAQATVLNLDTADEPLVVRGYQLPTILMRMLRDYFQQGQPRWIPAAKDLYWLDPQVAVGSGMTAAAVPSAMDIGRFGEYRGDAHNQQPKIVIRRESLARVPNGFRHGLRQLPSGPGRVDGQGGGPIYEKVWAGSAVFFCMSRHEAEAELIAFEVSELFSHFEDKIRCDCKLKSFQASQVGALGILKQYPQFLVVPVVVDYAYQDNIQITSGKLPFREIVVDAK